MFKIIISLAFLGDLQIYTFLETVIYGNQQTNVSNLPDVYMSAIQNGRHKNVFSKYLGI